jgi:hypothetical protein
MVRKWWLQNNLVRKARRVTVILQGTRCKSQNDDMPETWSVLTFVIPPAGHIFVRSRITSPPDFRTQEKCQKCVMRSCFNRPKYAKRTRWMRTRSVLDTNLRWRLGFRERASASTFRSKRRTMPELKRMEDTSVLAQRQSVSTSTWE